jgi:adhesin/invasin
MGLGPVNPSVPAGTLFSGATNLTLPLEISFGNTAANVVYKGLAPGFTGLYQLNVVVPQVPDSDAVPLTLKLNGVPGTQTLYIAVHQ